MYHQYIIQNLACLGSSHPQNTSQAELDHKNEMSAVCVWKLATLILPYSIFEATARDESHKRLAVAVFMVALLNNHKDDLISAITYWMHDILNVHVPILVKHW